MQEAHVGSPRCISSHAVYISLCIIHCVWQFAVEHKAIRSTNIALRANSGAALCFADTMCAM